MYCTSYTQLLPPTSPSTRQLCPKWDHIVPTSTGKCMSAETVWLGDSECYVRVNTSNAKKFSILAHTTDAEGKDKS